MCNDECSLDQFCACMLGQGHYVGIICNCSLVSQIKSSKHQVTSLEFCPVPSFLRKMHDITLCSVKNLTIDLSMRLHKMQASFVHPRKLARFCAFVKIRASNLQIFLANIAQIKGLGAQRVIFKKSLLRFLYSLKALKALSLLSIKLIEESVKKSLKLILQCMSSTKAVTLCASREWPVSSVRTGSVVNANQRVCNSRGGLMFLAIQHWRNCACHVLCGNALMCSPQASLLRWHPPFILHVSSEQIFMQILCKGWSDCDQIIGQCSYLDYE